MADHTSSDPAGDLDAEGVPEEDLPPGLAGTGGDYEEIAAPRETPGPSVDYGTTAAEQQVGEPLAMRVAREEPDVSPAGGEQPVADLEGDPLAARPAEEEAVHITEEG
jgi:hypothetical protein